MPIFDSDASDNALSVTVPPITVYVSSITPPPGGSPTDQPTWGNWTIRPRLQATGAFRGSSFGGMSYATIKLAPGRPLDNNDTRIESLESISAGDRVAICRGVKGEGGFKVLFCGYHTAANINISSQAESLVLRLVGPEWLWGEDGADGSFDPVVGQWRRLHSAEDEWLTTPSTVATRDELFLDTSSRCVFNPDSRKNRSTGTVEYDAATEITGEVFQTPDLIDKSDYWTRESAVKLLISLFNDPVATGIGNPTDADWNTGDLGDDAIRSIDVDGMGLWDALRRLLEPRYGFYVTPTQPNIDANNWGPFQITFFERSNGASAQIPLNTFGTSIASAQAAISRLEAAKDIGKTVTSIAVLGHRYKQVRLQYFGADTPTISVAQKRVALQPAWLPTDGTLGDFTATILGLIGGITPWSIAFLGQTTLWNDRFVVGGKEFPKYAHVFRCFVWNEANELRNVAPPYPTYGTVDGTPVEYAWFAPALANIADDNEGDRVNRWARRRRPLLDTLYVQPGLDGYVRVPPSLYLASVHPTSDLQSPWIRVPTDKYRIDRDRAAIWITEGDLSQWRPMEQSGVRFADHGGSHVDSRSFATLLHHGKLRLMVEATIETDWPILGRADRTPLAGSPFTRIAAFRNDNYIETSEYAEDGSASPAGITATPVDTQIDAQAFAENQQIAGQDQQCHASILLEADWPEYAIGTMINGTSGRVINLTGGPAGRGAQVVALFMDFIAFKWELLTESVALQLRDIDRAQIGRDRQRKRQRGAMRAGAGRFDEANIQAGLIE